MKRGKILISDKVFEGVLECILRADSSTREGIAQKIEYSSATVGKAVNWLLDAGVIEQKMTSSGHAGRKVGVLKLCTDKNFAVINLSCRNFEFSVLNSRLELIENIGRSIEDSLTPMENLRVFLNDIRAFVGEDEENDMIFGIVLPPEKKNCDESKLDFTLDEVNLLFSDIFDFGAACILTSDEAIATAIVKHPRYCSADRVFYLGVSDSISSFLVENGKIIRGVNAAHAIVGDGTLGAKLTGDAAYEDTTHKIASTLANIMTLCAPELILLEGKLIRISNVVYDKALELCAPFVPVSRLAINKNTPFADDIGVAIAMRDTYIKQKIDKIKERRKKKNYDFEY